MYEQKNLSLPLCACGCGARVRNAHRRYLVGHASKGRKYLSERFKEIHRQGLLSGGAGYGSGPNSANWKGGLSTAKARLRSKGLAKWRFAQREKAGDKCGSCGLIHGAIRSDTSKVKIEVHHDKERFNDIYVRFLNNLFPNRTESSLSWDEGTVLINEVANYHNDHVEGVVICNRCHSKQHTNTTKPIGLIIKLDPIAHADIQRAASLDGSALRDWCREAVLMRFSGSLG